MPGAKSGRIDVRRGQGVARPATAPAAAPAQREHPRIADRGRAELEALAGRNWLGPTTRPLWQPRGHREGAAAVYGSLVIPALASVRAAKGLFQQAGALSE